MSGLKMYNHHVVHVVVLIIITVAVLCARGCTAGRIEMWIYSTSVLCNGFSKNTIVRGERVYAPPNNKTVRKVTVNLSSRPLATRRSYHRLIVPSCNNVTCPRTRIISYKRAFHIVCTRCRRFFLLFLFYSFFFFLKNTRSL